MTKNATEHVIRILRDVANVMSVTMQVIEEHEKKKTLGLAIPCTPGIEPERVWEAVLLLKQDGLGPPAKRLWSAFEPWDRTRRHLALYQASKGWPNALLKTYDPEKERAELEALRKNYDPEKDKSGKDYEALDALDKILIAGPQEGDYWPEKEAHDVKWLETRSFAIQNIACELIETLRGNQNAPGVTNATGGNTPAPAGGQDDKPETHSGNVKAASARQHRKRTPKGETPEYAIRAAVLLKDSNGTITDAQAARTVGVNRSTLCRSPFYRKARKDFPAARLSDTQDALSSENKPQPTKYERLDSQKKRVAQRVAQQARKIPPS